MELAVALFPSSNFAIFSKKALQRKGLYVKLIPVPRALSSNCGVCLQFYSRDSPIVQALLEERQIPYESVVEFR